MQAREICLFHSVQPNLGPTQLPIQCVQGGYFPGGKAVGG
jgi:hypothetical protein